MSARELTVLGSASQVPTRHRNHNGYFLRWDSEGILFDPGEGTQRQMTFAGISSSSITRICITHLHGDHCLGLPGIIQRLSLDQVEHPIDLYYPASGQDYIDRLRMRASSSIAPTFAATRFLSTANWLITRSRRVSLMARTLDHGVDSVGYQLVEPDSVRMVPERLLARGISGPDVGSLQRNGSVTIDGAAVALVDVSEPKPGQRFAFVMDTRACANAVLLAERADMLVCESTFSAADEAIARAHGHLSSTQAATIASQANARLLVLTHFSQRYDDVSPLLVEARSVFPNAIAARDLLRIAVPARV